MGASQGHIKKKCVEGEIYFGNIIYHKENDVNQGILFGPVLKKLYFHCRGAGSIPGQGTKIPHATWYSRGGGGGMKQNKIKIKGNTKKMLFYYFLKWY